MSLHNSSHLRTSVSLLLEWFFVLEALRNGPGGPRLPPPETERLVASSPELVARAARFWDDDGDFSELLLLGARAAVLLEPDRASVHAGLARAAALPPEALRLSTEVPERRAVLGARLAALAAHPQLRREYLGLIEAVADVTMPGWEAWGAARATLASTRVSRATVGRSFVELLAPREAAARAAAARALSASEANLAVLVVPVANASGALVLDVGADLLVSVAARPSGRLDERGARELARRARALGDPTRLSIIDTLANGACGIGELAVQFGLAQPTVSNHVRVLREAGLVRNVPRGAGRGVVLDDDGLAGLVAELAYLARTGASPRLGESDR